MDDLLEKGATLVVAHIMEDHPDIVREHLLYHPVTLTECVVCFLAHDVAMQAAIAERN